MKQERKFSSGQQESQQQQQGTAAQNSQQAREFATAEELLRFDHAQTAVPAGIARRLAKSAEHLPPPKRSWWARLFGK